jgi:hypothetical protein
LGSKFLTLLQKAKTPFEKKKKNQTKNNPEEGREIPQAFISLHG